MRDDALQIALDTINKGKQAIIFAPSRASAEKTAQEISRHTAIVLPELEKDVLHALSTPTTQCRKLSQCIRKGIAFHHAGLVEKQRTCIEDEFRKGTIKIICATPTLAAGLSLPAFRVIIKSLRRYSGQWGMGWIPVLEYLQMAGRAGRPEYEDCGEAISLAKNESEKEEIYSKFICGVPEDIYSKVAAEPVLRTYLLSLISSGIIRDEATMQEFFAKTFWAHQFGDMEQLQGIMEKMLSLLDKWEFVRIGGEHADFVSAAEMGRAATVMKPTIVGKRVSELYLDPLTARYLVDCLQNYTAKKSTFSLLQMISHTLEMRPLVRTKSKEEDKLQEELVKRYHLLLEKEPNVFDPGYSEFIDSIKTALFLESWIEEKDEEFLLDMYGIRPGEIRVKIEKAEWLLYAAEELAKITDNRKDLLKELAKLRIRVKNGVKEDLLPLLRLKGIGRVRARKLVKNGFKDLGALRRADIATITQILGRAVAEDVKKQLGDEVEEVSLGTRRGQLSVQKLYK